MLRTATAADLASLCALFASANDAPYDLARVAEEKCFSPGLAGAPRTRVFERDGRLLGAAVSCGRVLRLLAVDRDARRQGIGSALLADAARPVIAAEAGNYFTPGVLASDEETLRFLRKRGYAEAWSTHNLEVDLESRESGVASRESGAPEGAPTRDVRLATPGEMRERVLSFIEREFGRAWRFEASRGATLFYVEADGEIAGFSTHEANNRGLGTFGPTGVAASMRRRGFGRLLLLASLADLRRLGYARATIPWTDALDFYARSCGARPAHRFLGLSKPIDSRP